MKVYFADGPKFGEVQELPDGTQFWDVAEKPGPELKPFTRKSAQMSTVVRFSVQRYRICVDFRAERHNVDAVGYIV